MTSKYEPVEDRMFVKQTIESEKRIGSIILPNNRKSIVLRGTVTAVGPLCKRIKPGDSVLFVHVAGVKCGLPELDDIEEMRQTVVIRENEIMAHRAATDDVGAPTLDAAKVEAA